MADDKVRLVQRLPKEDAELIVETFDNTESKALSKGRVLMWDHLCTVDTAVAVFAAVWALTGFIVLPNLFREESEDDSFHIIDSLYFMIQIITTVGYGDVTPKTDSMKLFVAAYVVSAVLFAAFAFTKLQSALVEKTYSITKANILGMSASRGQSQSGPREAERIECPCIDALTSQWCGVAVAVLMFAGAILAGALFYSKISNEKRSFVDAVYMSCITLTTVGFGDEVPESQFGRCFAILWMTFGTASLANLISQVSHTIMALQVSQERKLSRSLFEKMDKDHTHTLSKFEFISFQLVRYGLVTEDDIATLMEEYDRLDANHDGTLTYADLGWDA